MAIVHNNRYPHLLPRDAAIWHRFLLMSSNPPTEIEYDVQVGKGRPAPQDLPDNIKTMSLQLSKRRIDAIGHTNKAIIIYEVTHSAGLTALGQLIAYPLLYQMTYKPTKPLGVHLVAGTIQSDIQPILTALRIPFTVTGIPELPPQTA